MTPGAAPRLDDILAKVRIYAPDADLDVVKRAYVFGERAHSGQRRKSGEPYFTHPMAVADLLADLKLDVDSLAAALLHDTVEDTAATLVEVEKYFGPDVAALVDGVTKLSKLDYRSAEEHQAESFRKVIFAMARDIRVILVKLADRTHNMRTLDSMRPDKQRRIAQETLDIYAPIANRLGISTLKAELENLSFRALHPEQYERLNQALEAHRPHHDRLIDRVRNALQDALVPAYPDCEIFGRSKQIYSIYRKMVEKHVEVDEISDLLAFRVLVQDVSACYGALGLVHSLWPPISERFKDYVARPKANGYRSLHTTVIDEGERLEVQIRTFDMHRFCEFGIAAHWRYKEGHLALSHDEIERYTRVRQLSQWAEQIQDSREFLDTIKLDLFADEVYVYTPKGEVRWFPKGATPLDFAYSIHTDVGNRCTGAKVNGRMVSLGYVLESGEVVQITTSPHQRPNRDWVDMVVTSRAKAKIRQYLRSEERDKAREVGRGLLERELKKYDLSLARVEKDGSLQKAVDHLRAGTVADLLLKVGFDRVELDRILPVLVPEERLKAAPPEPEKEERGLRALIRNLSRKRAASSPIKIDGADNLLVLFAKCCKPLPGDPVVGYVTRGRGITVHSSSCPQTLQADPERRVEVQWNKGAETLHHATLQVVSVDQPGVLASLTKAIGNLKVNISKAEARTTRDQRGIHTFEVLVKDLGQLVQVQHALEAQKGVITVSRLRG